MIKIFIGTQVMGMGPFPHEVLQDFEDFVDMLEMKWPAINAAIVPMTQSSLNEAMDSLRGH